MFNGIFTEIWLDFRTLRFTTPLYFKSGQYVIKEYRLNGIVKTGLGFKAGFLPGLFFAPDNLLFSCCAI